MAKFTASGDALIQYRIPTNHISFKLLGDFIKKGDARITNLETVISDFDCFASSYCGGTWLNAHPDVIDDLVSYGFNLFAWANNHTMDYSYDGLYSTKKTLELKNLVHAGAGLSLYEASKPVSINTEAGRIALISQCSTFVDAARAGNPKGSIPARPGLNPLRYSVEYVVTSGQMRCLKEIDKLTNVNGRKWISRKQGYTPLPPDGCFDFGGIIVREGEVPKKITRVNEIDMKRTEDGIKSSLLSNDYVLVSFHSHEDKGRIDTEPAEFIEEYCHRCIDAGATAVIGTGTHQVRGIEIYKGKPIFYSLGNFIFQSDSPEQLPADFFERYGFPVNISAEQGINLRTNGGQRGLHASPVYFKSILPYWKTEGNDVKRILLMPIDLGYDASHNLHGIPSPADPIEIIDYLRDVSLPYGTKYKIIDNLIEICL